MPEYIYNATRRSQPRKRRPIFSIMDIIFEDGSTIHIYKGSISQNDIWIKYIGQMIQGNMYMKTYSFGR